MPNQDTAKALVVPAVPRVSGEATVGEIFKLLQTEAGTYESIEYVYVLEHQKLIGVVSLHELFAADPNIQVSNIMTMSPVCVHGHTDKEHVVEVALAQNIKAVPVVGDAGEFLGIVQPDDIFRVLHEEHMEDLYLQAGISLSADSPTSELTVYGHFKSRIPWLLIGLVGGMCAAFVIDMFEGILETNIILAAFIPAIVYIADAVGGQSQMLYVRRLASLRKTTLFPVLTREWAVGTLVGALLSVVIFVLSFLWIGDSMVSSILAVAVFFTVLFSVTVAIILPWVFKRLSLDPATASGPLATVVRDISSLAIYLAIAVTFL